MTKNNNDNDDDVFDDDLDEEDPFENLLERNFKSIRERTKIPPVRAKIAAGLYQGMSKQEICDHFDLDEGHYNASRQRLKDSREKAEKTIDVFENGVDTLDQDGETYFSKKHLKLMMSDPDRTYLKKEDLQERMKENEDLEIKTVHDLKEETNLTNISETKSHLKKKVRKARNTVEVVDQVL